jgi:hypothetical protein
MNLPDGRLLKSRVVSDPRYPLAEALDRNLTGYAVLEPQETLLLEGEGRGVVTFRDGVPELTYATGTERGGPAALGDLAMPGPYHVELYELPAGAFDALDDAAAFRVPPGMPAERLAGDPALAASTRRAAPDARVDAGTGTGDASDADSDGEGSRAPEDRSAVEAFLDDEEKIEAIREQARREAEARAEEWGFD